MGGYFEISYRAGIVIFSTFLLGLSIAQILVLSIGSWDKIVGGISLNIFAN